MQWDLAERVPNLTAEELVVVNSEQELQVIRMNCREVGGVDVLGLAQHFSMNLRSDEGDLFFVKSCRFNSLEKIRRHHVVQNRMGLRAQASGLPQAMRDSTRFVWASVEL